MSTTSEEQAQRTDRQRRSGESEASWANRVAQSTGRRVWLVGHPQQADESRAETVWQAGALIGEVVGSWVRTSETHEGMPVWRHSRGLVP